MLCECYASQCLRFIGGLPSMLCLPQQKIGARKAGFLFDFGQSQSCYTESRLSLRHHGYRERTIRLLSSHRILARPGRALGPSDTNWNRIVVAPPESLRTPIRRRNENGCRSMAEAQPCCISHSGLSQQLSSQRLSHTYQTKGPWEGNIQVSSSQNNIKKPRCLV